VVRDVGDHPVRVAERVEAFDSLLTDIFTAHLAQITIPQTDEARRRTRTPAASRPGSRSSRPTP
jgi:hypothetical protein